MDWLWLLCREVPPGGPLTGEFINDPDEKLAWLPFWRDHVMAAIGGTEGEEIAHQTGTAAAMNSAHHIASKECRSP
jgi:hypothetical protein